MPSRRPSSAAFSLVELLIVIAVMGIVAALTLPSVNSGIHDQLQATADAIAGDLAYARGLAVANNSSYRLTFDLANNQFTLQHSGANPALATLPPNPFQAASSDSTRFVVQLDDMPSLGGRVRLAAVGTVGSRPSSTDASLAERGRRTCTTLHLADREPGNRPGQRRCVHGKRTAGVDLEVSG
jgi:prepilin-type N-terminal cleavage/methylation domain-containing protein